VWKSGRIQAAANEGEASVGERNGEGAQSHASVTTEEKGESVPKLQQVGIQQNLIFLRTCIGKGGKCLS
jgi:hypothetical protein